MPSVASTLQPKCWSSVQHTWPKGIIYHDGPEQRSSRVRCQCVADIHLRVPCPRKGFQHGAAPQQLAARAPSGPACSTHVPGFPLSATRLSRLRPCLFKRVLWCQAHTARACVVCNILQMGLALVVWTYIVPTRTQGPATLVLITPAKHLRVMHLPAPQRHSRQTRMHAHLCTMHKFVPNSGSQEKHTA